MVKQQSKLNKNLTANKIKIKRKQTLENIEEMDNTEKLTTLDTPDTVIQH